MQYEFVDGQIAAILVAELIYNQVHELFVIHVDTKVSRIKLPTAHEKLPENCDMKSS